MDWRLFFIVYLLVSADANSLFAKRLSKLKLWSSVDVKEGKDILFEREVLQTVYRPLQALGDFSSFNTNYIENQFVLEEMNSYFKKQDLPGLAFEMQGLGTFGDLYENRANFVAVQFTFGLFDFPSDNATRVGALEIERITEWDGVEVLKIKLWEIEIRCMAFVMNIVKGAQETGSSELQLIYVSSFSEGLADTLLEKRVISLSGNQTVEILDIFLKLPPQNARFKIDEFDDENDEELSAGQLDILVEQAREWLDYIGCTFVYRFVYALLGITREQLLEDEQFDNEKTSQVPNIVMLNQQVYELQQEIQKIPYVYGFASADFMADTMETIISTSELENLLTTIPMRLDKGDYGPAINQTKMGTFTPGNMESSYAQSITLHIASGVVARTSIIYTCDWTDYDVNYNYNTKYHSYFSSQLAYNCRATLDSTMDVLFTSASKEPYEVEQSGHLSFNVKFASNVVEFKYADAKTISIETNGYWAYGLRYTQIATNGTIEIRKGGSLRLGNLDMSSTTTKCSGECYIVLNNQMHPDGFMNIHQHFSKFPRPFYLHAVVTPAIPETLWNRDLEFIGIPGMFTDGAFSLNVQFSPEQSSFSSRICLVQLDRTGAGLPFSQKNSVNLLDVQLTQLANQVQSLEDRVQTLEDAVFQSQKTIWTFISAGLSMVDIAFNVYELGKVGVGMSKSAISTLKRTTVADTMPLAKQFADKASHKAASYSVLDGIESASQVSHLQGHKKNFFYGNGSSSKLSDMDIHFIRQNKKDVREVMELNPSVFAQVQSLCFDSIKPSTKNDFTKNPFGVVSVHKSPIDVPILNGATKYLNERSTDSQSGRSFLANDQQRFPFHTSVSSSAIEIRTDDKIVLNTRFTGIAEPSIIGPTNAKNPPVKVGYVKVQHELVELPDGKSSLRLLQWHETETRPGKFYSASDVDHLYATFFPKGKDLSTDDKWTLVAHQTAARINTRDKIDYVPLQSNIFSGALDEMMSFSQTGGIFKYNLLNNNCQTYAKAFAQMAAFGNTQLDMVASDFRSFSMRVAAFADEYFANSAAMSKVVTWSSQINEQMHNVFDIVKKVIHRTL